MSKKLLELTPSERKTFICEARKELVDRLYNELSEDVQLVSKSRLAGLMDVDPKTLEAMGIPRVTLTGKLAKYRLKTVAQLLSKIEDK